jgi:hypothetical protein
MLIEYPNPTDNRLSYLIPYFNMWKSKNSNIIPFIPSICRFKRQIITNNFINNEIKELSFVYLDNIVRKEYLKRKYYKLWLYRYICKKSSINFCDLELNEINTSEDIIMYIDNEEHQKYLFTQNDFNKLVQTNLEHSYAYDSIPEPLTIKNPYNNKEFHKCDLINIDKQLKNAPLVWHMFKNCRYDINRLKAIHYQYLLGVCISSFIDGLENEDIVFYLNDMFEFFKIDCYCKKCIDEFRDIRSKLVRNTLIKWIAALKLAVPFIREDMYYLIKLYISPCIIHNKRKIITKTTNTLNINIQFTGGPLNPNQIYIFKAEPKIIKTKRVNSKNVDITERHRRKLKKSSGIKSIE